MTGLEDALRSLERNDEREQVIADREAAQRTEAIETAGSPLDRLLEGLRACGDDQNRGDPDDPHRWRAYCPCCASELIGVRSLTVRELPGGRATLCCWRGCPSSHILGAIRMAEAAWKPPAGLAMAEAGLQRIREAERLACDLEAA